MIQKPLLDRLPQRLQALRPGFSLAGLGDQDVRQVVGVAVGVVPFEAAEEGEVALAAAAPADVVEAGGGEGGFQDLAVPEELVAPPPEGAVDGERRLPLLRGLAVLIFNQAVKSLPDQTIDENQKINPLGISLDPDRWEADGLFDESGLTVAQARELAPDVEENWIDQAVAAR